MLLCLDISNTHVLGGIFHENNLIARFRYATHLIGTADQFGIFLINMLAFNKIAPAQISGIAVCSVVPSYDFTIKHTMSLYFQAAQFFILQPGVRTGLNIKYKNPNEVGADRIANAMAAVDAFPNKNIIIVDMGTATIVCAVSKSRDYLGGAIFAGIRLSMESLKNNTAKLIEVDLDLPPNYVGRTVKESLQAGLYYAQLGALKEMISGFNQELFLQQPAIVIGTGGFAQLYKDKSLFDVILPDLVLQGLSKAFKYYLNQDEK